jgi:hypothetical protein
MTVSVNIRSCYFCSRDINVDRSVSNSSINRSQLIKKYRSDLEADWKKSEVSPCISTNFEVWQIIFTIFTCFSLWLLVSIYVHAIFAFPNYLYIVGPFLLKYEHIYIWELKTLCHRIENKINWQFAWLKVASINISRSSVWLQPPFSWCHFYLILNEIKVSLNRNGLLFKKVTFKILNE